MKNDIQLVSITELPDDTVTGLTNGFDSETSAHAYIAKSFVYNEMADIPLSRRTEMDVLKDNMVVLSDLSDRLAFLSTEIKYLLNLK